MKSVCRWIGPTGKQESDCKFINKAKKRRKRRERERQRQRQRERGEGDPPNWCSPALEEVDPWLSLSFWMGTYHEHILICVSILQKVTSSNVFHWDHFDLILMCHCTASKEMVCVCEERESRRERETRMVEGEKEESSK